MSAYHRRWDEEQQAVPRAPRHPDRHPANLAANVRVLRSEIVNDELCFNIIFFTRPPAPEIQEIIEVEPVDAPDSEEFVFKGSTHPDAVLAGLDQSKYYQPIRELVALS